MNYFDFYNIPIAFDIDLSALRRQFLTFSKQYHPDFYTLESETKQAEILELSTLNNEAYKLLKDKDKRIQYILELKGLLGKEIKTELPQAFLLDMMDINEQIMELQFDYDQAAHLAIAKEVQAKEEALEVQVLPLLEQYNDAQSNIEDLEKIRDYYLQNRYLTRLKENLNKLG